MGRLDGGLDRPQRKQHEGSGGGGQGGQREGPVARQEPGQQQQIGGPAERVPQRHQHPQPARPPARPHHQQQTAQAERQPQPDPLAKVFPAPPGQIASHQQRRGARDHGDVVGVGESQGPAETGLVDQHSAGGGDHNQPELPSPGDLQRPLQPAGQDPERQPPEDVADGRVRERAAVGQADLDHHHIDAPDGGREQYQEVTPARSPSRPKGARPTPTPHRLKHR